jgi:hypothetical protein
MHFDAVPPSHVRAIRNDNVFSGVDERLRSDIDLLEEIQ